MSTPRSVLFDAEIRRICLIRLRRMGDIMLMTPCFRALRRWWPSAEITVLINRPFDQLLLNNPNVDEVVTLPRRGTWEMLRTSWRLRRRRFDMLINFHGGSTSALMTLVIGARFRVGERRFHRRFAYNVIVDPEEGADTSKPLHTVERQMRFLEALGVPPVPLKLEVSIESAARERMQQSLAKLGIGEGEPFALLRPAASARGKQWPARRFAAVADWLVEKRGIPVVTNVGPGEEATAEEFEQAARRKHPRVVTPGPKDLVALIGASSLFVANDSGPTHVAAALGKPVVVIFGGSDGVVWRPWSERSRVVQHRLECTPCVRWECTNPERYRCLEMVTVEEVQSAIDDLLAAEARREQSGVATGE